MFELVTFFLMMNQNNQRVNQEGFHRIRVGMQRAEVIRVLGSRPGSYAFGAIDVKTESLYVSFDSIKSLVDTLNTPSQQSLVWCGSKGVIVVHFDEDNKVFAAYFFEVVDRGIAVKIDRWLRRFSAKILEWR